ncbi:carbon-nitrogen hydrolase family protein [Campylobacter sp.]|uniref:carbon-nitrogen hydrolase family protein n=1 Tax=Campylobacter sp. TaxID=205 RepID=UPI0026F92048|nr:carbon-nitrogen hydrolase family protein [Campylobacter sp.]
MSSICALQLPTQPMSDSRLDYYFKMCSDNDTRLVVLGEYVLNSFFKELESMPKSMVKEQSERKKESLIKFAKKYDIIIVAPMVLVKGKEFVKVVAKFSPAGTKFLKQQILMPYSHWNEDKFFANSSENESELEFLTFTHDRLKFGLMFGYEAHFDACWAYMMKKRVDAVLVPSACTFFSESRWEQLLKTRAFTNGVYVLRVNRVGNHKSSDEQWKFYGDSMLINPFGEIEARLGKNEEMLLAKLDKKEVLKARNLWQFNLIINKRKLI